MTTVQKLILVAAVFVVVATGVIVYANGVTCDETWAYTTKQYHPAYTDYYTTMECFSRDKKGNCTLRMPVQHSVFHPERWTLYYKDGYDRDQSRDVGPSEFESPAKTYRSDVWRWQTCPPRRDW